MKKKIFLVSIALILALVCLAACNDYSQTMNKVNSLLEVDYSQVMVTVTTTTSGVTLKGEYQLTFEEDQTVIVYSYEELNELSMTGDNSMKNVVSGTAVVENGVVTSNTQNVNLNTEQLEFTGFTFKSTYFSNVIATANKFDADVSSPKGFLGYSDFSGSKMHVKVFFGAESISEINLTYRSANGADISIVYLLTV